MQKHSTVYTKNNVKYSTVVVHTACINIWKKLIRGVSDA